MALASCTVFEAGHTGWQVGAVVVDHALQDDSAAVSAAVALRLSQLGCDPVDVVRVQVAASGAGGLEAAARSARYQALAAAADDQEALVLLGHTRDDQAESVLLGLARGSGTRSLAGMAARRGIFRRPLLDVDRAETRRVCAALGLTVWDDPHNADPRFARARVRLTVLPTLEAELGPGVAGALARTADLARLDADALDSLAAELLVAATLADGALSVELLAPALAAVRRRCLRQAALAAGCPGGELVAVHVEGLDALVTDWHGQGELQLPGGVTASRLGDRLVLWEPRPRGSERRREGRHRDTGL